jgi:hypothetical protein
MKTKNTVEGIELRIDIRTNIGLLKNKIDEIEQFREQINNDLNKHISSLLNLHTDLESFEKDLVKHLETE